MKLNDTFVLLLNSSGVVWNINYLIRMGGQKKDKAEHLRISERRSTQDVAGEISEEKTASETISYLLILHTLLVVGEVGGK